MLAVVEEQKGNHAQTQQVMRQFSTATRVYEGKKRLPLEVYKANSLARIADLERQMREGQRRSPEWKRIQK